MCVAAFSVCFRRAGARGLNGVSLATPHTNWPPRFAGPSPENAPVVERARRLVREQFTARVMGRRWTDYLLRILPPE